MDEFFLSGCQIAFTDYTIRIDAPTQLTALALRKYKKELAQWAINFKKELTQVFFPGCNRPFEFPICLAKDSSSNCLESIKWLATQKEQEHHSMSAREFNPASDTNIAMEAFSSQHPVWITRMTDQKVMLCNKLAVDTQQKDPTDLVYCPFMG